MSNSERPDSAASQQPTKVRRPTSVVVVSAMVLIEALAVVGAAVLAVMALGHPSTVSVAGQVFLVVLMFAAALWQGAVALKHLAGRAWTRSAVVVWQLFQIILGVYYISNAPSVHDWAGLALGIGMVVVAAVALLSLFSPATRSYLEVDDAPR